MPSRKIAAIVLAAGHGTRMKSDRPKVLHPLAGQPMVRHVLAALDAACIDDIHVVVGPDMDAVADAVRPHTVSVQTERLGTAHAVLAARDAVAADIDDLLILNGDNPLIPAADIAALLTKRAETDAAVVVLGFHAADPGPYGRLVRDSDGGLARIVEARDADAPTSAIDLCSSGMMAIDGAIAFALLDAVGNDNAAGEYYLPDVVAVARARGRLCAVVEGDEADLLGINSRAELAVAEARVQNGLRENAMAGGATLIDPGSVFLCMDTEIGRDVTIEPNVVFGPGVSVADGATIRAFSHVEGARIGEGATVGPFARLRPGTEIADGARVGNFVEVKNATLGPGAKVNHLSYVGDADVGAAANIGAGTITCNYDGVFKWRTTIGAGAFIGSNSALVAPVTVGAGATVGAGSAITGDVAKDALAVTRAKQREVKDWARKTRERKQALKDKGEKG